MVSVIFFGSGPVAAKSLRLLQQHTTVEAVVTKPTTKAEMQAAAPDKPLYTVSTKAELDDIFGAEKFASPVGVLIDFGIIVSQKIIDYFPKGIVNSHFSLLPELRGADPISFAILEGKQETGVSLMLLVEAMDEGPIITMGVEPLTGHETSPELTDRLIHLSNALLSSNLPAYVTNTVHSASGVVPTPRSQETVCELADKPYAPTYTRKLTKADGIIDWNKPAVQIEREIRAYIEWPKSRTNLGDIDCVITSATVLNDISISGAPGSVTVQDKQLIVLCGEGALAVQTIKPAGKKDMDVQGFLAGYKNKLPL